VNLGQPQKEFNENLNKQFREQWALKGRMGAVFGVFSSRKGPMDI
jgi:hypothetical protein